MGRMDGDSTLEEFREALWLRSSTQRTFASRFRVEGLGFEFFRF